MITYISVICGNQAEARKREKGKMAFMGQGVPARSLGQLQRLCGCLPLRGDELPWTNVRCCKPPRAPPHAKQLKLSSPPALAPEIFKAT